MSVTTRTNLLKYGTFEGGITTGWTGTNCTLGTSLAKSDTGLYSMTLTASTAAAFSAATATGTSGIPVTAGLSYAFQMKSETAVTSRTVTLSITWYNSAGTSLSTSTGTGVADTTTGFTLASVVATAPATAAFASLKVAYNTAATSEVHYVDTGFFEQAASVGVPFDGDTVDSNGVIYSWTSTPYQSTSTAVTYTPAIAIAAGSTPCPNVTLTITDLTPTDNAVNVWRTADGVRTAVRGTKGVTINGSAAVVDYEVPLGRTVAYDLEVLTGISTGVVTPTATTTVASPTDALGKATWWIQDPLVPGSAIALSVARGDKSRPYLTAAAVKSLEYSSDVTIIPVAGSSQPVAIGGQRLIAQNVPFDMFTNTNATTISLRTLLQQTAVLLIRSPGVRNDGIPGLFYTAVPKAVEQPVTVAFGGTLTKWSITGSGVAAPTAAILVPVWTYGSVQALWATYQQAQTTLAAKTYLDVLKSPTGA
jgi:hypothetical protein